MIINNEFQDKGEKIYKELNGNTRNEKDNTKNKEFGPLGVSDG